MELKSRDEEGTFIRVSLGLHLVHRVQFSCCSPIPPVQAAGHGMNIPSWMEFWEEQFQPCSSLTQKWAKMWKILWCPQLQELSRR